MKYFFSKPWYFVGGGVFVLGVIVLSISFFSVFRCKAVIDRPRVQFEIPKDKIKKVVLQNGMTVLVFERKDIPKVLVQIAYDVGSGVEESGERGLAHLLEHMIFKGTEKLSETDIDSIGRKYGASMNAFTAKDITSYYFETNKNNWEPFLQILSDCMVNCRFDDQHLASELKTVIQELRRGEDNYGRWMYNTACKILYPANHPYHHPVLGFKEDLLTLSGQRIKDFYSKYYHPDKATLFIVGDVDTERAIELARLNFEKIKGPEKKLKTRILPQELVEVSNQVSRVYKDIKKEQLAFYWKIPGLKSGNKVLTNIVQDVLGAGEGSVLYKKLVDEEKVAISVETLGYQIQKSGIFFILVEPKDGLKDKCREIIKQELHKIIDSGVKTDILTKVVRRNERQFFQMLSSNSSLVYEWINSFFASGDEYKLFRTVDDFYKADKDAIKEFAKNYLDPFLMNELNVLPIPDHKKDLWVKNKRLSESMDKKILQTFVRTAPLEEPSFVKLMPEPNPLEFAFPKPDKIFELKNGLKIVLRKSKELPLVATACNFKDASFISKSIDGLKVGVMMDMLMEQSDKFSKSDNVDFFELYGADYTFGSGGVFLSTVNVGYKPILERFFHVLTKPKFDKKALEKIKAIYIDSYQRRKDSPHEVASNLGKTLVYKNHPYGWSFDEAIKTIKSLFVKDLKTLHKKYISPDNMFLVVSGDFDLDEISEDIKNVFEGWSGKKRVEIKISEGAFVAKERRYHKMLRDQVVLLMQQKSPINIYHEDRVPLKLLNFISFYSLGSRIYKLRERTGLFYGAGGGFGEGATKVHGFDYAWALLSVDKVDMAEKQIRELVDKIGAQGVTKGELDDARQWYLKILIDLVSNNSVVAGVLAGLEEFDLGFDYYDKVLKRVQTINSDELNEISKKYFNSEKFSTIRVGRV